MSRRLESEGWSSAGLEELKNSGFSMKTNAFKHQSKQPLEHKGPKATTVIRMATLWGPSWSKKDDGHEDGDPLGPKAMTLSPWSKKGTSYEDGNPPIMSRATPWDLMFFALPPCPLLKNRPAQRLCVLACEAGGRWNIESHCRTTQFVRLPSRHAKCCRRTGGRAGGGAS